MISLSPNTALMLYLCLTLAILFGVWLSNHYKTRRKKIVLAEEHLLVCEYCHCAYLAQAEKQVTQCPQCNSYNKNNSYKNKE